MDKQIRLFLNKLQKSPITQKCHTGDKCESLKTTESKEISLFLRFPCLGNTSLQIEKEHKISIHFDTRHSRYWQML